jgi:hypothetical protein
VARVVTKTQSATAHVVQTITPTIVVTYTQPPSDGVSAIQPLTAIIATQAPNVPLAVNQPADGLQVAASPAVSLTVVAAQAIAEQAS